LAQYYGDGSNDLNVYQPPFYPFAPVGSIAAKYDTLVAVSIESHIVVWLGGRLDFYYPTTLSSTDFNITAMVYGSFNHLWIGMKNAGVAQRFGDEWEFYNSLNSNLSSDQVTSIVIDNLGIVWAGHASSDRLSYYDGTSWQSYYIFPNRYRVSSLYVDFRNRLWIGTNNGLIEKDGNTITFYNYDNSGLNINNVSGVAVDKNGYVWITTFDAGLFRYRGAL